MDAATLYTIITLASGEHRTSTRAFPSAAQCERAAKLLRMEASLSSKTQFYCVKHERAAHPNASTDVGDGDED
jgi:hypothetical protein